MAMYQWITHTDKDELFDAVSERINKSRFRIEKQGTTPVQILAVYTPLEIVRYWSGVRMLATWVDRNAKTIKIEVRSDEPMLRVNTHCEEGAKELMKFFPPIC